LDKKTAGTYVSKQIGLKARKIRAAKALDTFADPVVAVTKYNYELGKLGTIAGGQFNSSFSRAMVLSYSEDLAKDYAIKCTANCLESEMELLDYEIPYASNTSLMINAKVGALLLGQLL
jgi:hypothetical protein